MSDEENSEDADFSGSEDEWKPDGEKSSSDVESGYENDEDSTFKNKEKRCTQKASKSSSTVSRRKLSQSLRSRMFNMYKPPPKSLNSSSSQFLNKNISSILQSSQFKKKKIASTQNAEESDSSGDDYLVDPKDLDLKSSFFDVNPKENEDEQAPEFDCNAGLHLSDSDVDEEDFQEVEDKHVINAKGNNSSNETSLKHLHDYALKLESAKEHLKCLKSESPKKEQDVDVSQLLAMGEAREIKEKSTSSRKRKKAGESDSESDWEEVKDVKSHANISKEEIQVTVQLQDKARDKKTVDLEAVLKRKLNRVIKENQIYFHKVSLLCHIAHGIYCNRALNNPTLMAQALKLLPNKTCYPNGRTEIKYFESMVKWYKAALVVKSNKMYSYFRTRPPLPISLALQIKNKAAICKKDFVLIFITLLRAMGIQCRMVMNLVPLPIRPAQGDLCKISIKKEPKNEQKETANKAKKDHVAVTKHSTKEDVKESQKINKISSETKNNSKTSCSVSQKKDKDKNKSQKVMNDFQTSDKISSRTRKKQKLQEAKENDENVQEKQKKPVSKSNKSGPVDSVKSETKDAGKSVKKLAKKVAAFKETQETDKSQHFLKRNTNRKCNEVTEKIGLTSSSSRSLRSKSKQKEIETPVVIPQLDGADDVDKKQPESRRGRKIKFALPKVHPDPPINSEDEFVPSPPKKMKSSSASNKKPIKRTRDKRVLSTDDDDNEKEKKKKNSMDIWVEVFAEEEDQWVTIDLFSSKVHCIDAIRKAATSPIAYVFAWNNDNTIKDVSARYCSQWHTVTRKLRVEQEWLDEALEKYVSKKTARDKKEDHELHKIHLEKPLPTTISEYKNHPLYALERHLLKFEAIYPPNALTLGFVRGEPVYARECVHTLHSRDIWLKQARVVKPGEKPYKIVKARPKWDKFTNTVIKDQPLEIYGYWQTMRYVPPTAENGIVPRNAYGNVELFKKCMLPKKTVHLQLPGLNRICKKLNIDCAPAVVGFDFHQGLCHPLMDGFVVCEEFGDQVTAAWYQEQEEAERRAEEKYQQRVYGNWKRLIKGLLIREKLKLKYNFEGVKYEEKEKVKRSKK